MCSLLLQYSKEIIYLSKMAVLISLKMFCAGCPCIQSEKSTSIQFVVFIWKSAPNFVNNSFVLLLFATNNACKPLNICSFSFDDSIDLSKVKFSSMIIPPFFPFRIYDEFPRDSIIEQNDFLFVTTLLPNSNILYSYILSFGEYVEIIEPQEIRKNIQSQLKIIQEKYQT